MEWTDLYVQVMVMMQARRARAGMKKLHVSGWRHQCNTGSARHSAPGAWRPHACSPSLLQAWGPDYALDVICIWGKGHRTEVKTAQLADGRPQFVPLTGGTPDARSHEQEEREERKRRERQEQKQQQQQQLEVRQARQSV